MIINNTPHIINFQGRLKLNEAMGVLKPSTSNSTCLDALFNRSNGVSFLENFAVFLKRNIRNKYFSKPQNVVTKSIRYAIDGLVFISRKLASKLYYFNNKTALNKLSDTFVKSSPDSAEYIEEISKIGNTVNDKYLVSNLKDCPLKLLGKNKDSTIFVLNHPDYNKDKFVYLIINSLLSKEYAKNGLQSVCPRPKILVSKNMKMIISPKEYKICEKLGLVPVDGNLNGKKTLSNITPMLGILKGYADNKSNVFIFPEGLMAPNVFLSLKDRIQPGIANFIEKALRLKNKVRVVPVGISYTKDKNNLGSIYFGKPLYFKKQDNKLIYTSGTSTRKISKSDINDSFNTIFDVVSDNIVFCESEAKSLK